MKTILQRFESKIDKTSSPIGCWLWTGSKNIGGYGKLSINYYPEYAHRFSYCHFRGTIPEGMLVCHVCDVRHCVNPDHLFVDTQFGNLQDMKFKNIKNGRKLSYSEDDEKLILELTIKGFKPKEIAHRVNIAISIIYKVIRNYKKFFIAS